jgi:hypothetical protein
MEPLGNVVRRLKVDGVGRRLGFAGPNGGKLNDTRSHDESSFCGP